MNTEPPDHAARSQGYPSIFMIAGEPSGDAIGARLMAALRRRTEGRVRIEGLGGEAMAAQGLQSLFPITELSVMGLVEVVPRIPRLVRRMRQTAAEIRRLAPDAVVTIDAPAFCAGVWKRLGRGERALVHYVAPTVWAWRPGRARAYARTIDHLLALLPFEPPFFEREGLACSFVGHPVLECGADAGDGAGFRARHGMADGSPAVGILPGSRGGEVRRLLPPFGEALALLAKSRPGLTAVVPLAQGVADAVADAVKAWPVRTVLVSDPKEKFDAMAACDVAIAASGTVALELALAGVPMVIGYRLNRLTGAIVRRMIRVEYVNLVNLLLDRRVVPELLLDECRADRLAAEAERLLDDEAARNDQLAACREAVAKLGGNGPAPSERAADVILDVIAARAGATTPGQ